MTALLQQLCSAAFNQQTFKAQLQNSNKLKKHEWVAGTNGKKGKHGEKWGKIRDGQGNCTTAAAAAAFNYDNQYSHTLGHFATHRYSIIYTVKTL